MTTLPKEPSPVREYAVRVDLGGPSVDADVRRLIARHGVNAVQEAINRETRRKPGRPVKKDWYLSELLRPDAERWLQSISPFAVEADNAIARKAVALYPDTGSNIKPGSQKTRILRKLRKRRLYYTIVEAWWISQENYPYTDHLRAISALVEVNIRKKYWEPILMLAREHVSDFHNKFGEPAAILTMREIEKGAGAQLASTPVPGVENVLQVRLGVARSG